MVWASPGAGLASVVVVSVVVVVVSVVVSFVATSAGASVLLQPLSHIIVTSNADDNNNFDCAGENKATIDIINSKGQNPSLSE